MVSLNNPFLILYYQDTPYSHSRALAPVWSICRILSEYSILSCFTLYIYITRTRTHTHAHARGKGQSTAFQFFPCLCYMYGGGQMKIRKLKIGNNGYAMIEATAKLCYTRDMEREIVFCHFLRRIPITISGRGRMNRILCLCGLFSNRLIKPWDKHDTLRCKQCLKADMGGKHERW